MKILTAGIKFLIALFVLITSMNLLGCGMTITQQAAQRAVADAQMAVSDARASRARLYSTDKMKKAERLLKEAEEAIAHGRKQRAYTLAMRAEESAQAAEQEARSYLEDSGIRTREYSQTPAKARTSASYDLPSPVYSSTMPETAYQRQQTPSSTARQKSSGSLNYEMPPDQIPEFAAPGDMETSPDQAISSIQNAVKTLEEAQKALDSARVAIAKAQAEIGLSLSSFVIQQLRQSGVSAEMMNMVNSWYDYAYKAMESGNYDEAARAVKRAQSYAQNLSRSTR